MRSDRAWQAHSQAFGEYLRAQRKLAELSLRDLSARTQVSNAYLSQLERGLHQPSVRVLRALAEALDVPPDQLLTQAGLLQFTEAAAPEPEEPPAAPVVETAIRADTQLSDAQKDALISVYRSYVADVPAS